MSLIRDDDHPAFVAAAVIMGLIFAFLAIWLMGTR